MYKAHLFICTNGGDQVGKCAQKGSEQLLAETKAKAKEKNWGSQVRVNKSGCLGQCEHGIASVIYPQAEWHLEQKPNQASELISAIENCLK